MYAADLTEGNRRGEDPVAEYLDLAESVLLEVFGYTDTGRDLDSDLDELEFRYRAIPASLRRHLELARHFQFVRTVALGGGK